MSEKEQVSERLGCSQAKGEVESEKHPISSRVAGEIESESSSLKSGAKGEDVRNVSQDEILMQQKREIERNAGTGATEKTL